MELIGNGGHAKVVRECFLTGPVIAIGDNATRKRIAQEQPKDWGQAIHRHAVISPTANLGPGVVVMAGAVIQPGASIGAHVIVNTLASVDHDCVVGDFAHIAPGAHLCGGVEIGEGTLVGVGVAIAPGARIPAWSLVKARGLEIVPL